MEAIICKQSALEYWRHDSDPIGAIPTLRQYAPSRKGPVQVETPHTSTLWDIVNLGLVSGKHIDLLVTDQHGRRALENVGFSIHEGTFPANSLVRTRAQIYVTCPELTFLMLAQELPFIELLEVGFELCGTYRMTEGRPTYDMAPLTTASRLRSFIERASDLRGSQAAHKAARWIRDSSGSPAETALAIVLGLPYRYGGFGLGAFELNRELALSETAARLLGRSSLRPDLFFPKQRHPVEYDSVLHHSGRDQAEYDERRRNAYSAMGMSVTVVRPRHLSNPSLFEDIVKSIRRNTGIGWNRTPQDFDERNQRLLNNAFRYWGGLQDTFGSGPEFFERSALWDKPDSPW